MTIRLIEHGPPKAQIPPWTLLWTLWTVLLTSYFHKVTGYELEDRDSISGSNHRFLSSRPCSYRCWGTPNFLLRVKEPKRESHRLTLSSPEVYIDALQTPACRDAKAQR